MGPEVFHDGGIPAVLLLDVDEGVVEGDAPEVALGVDGQPVVLVRGTAKVPHPLVHPQDLALLTVEAHQLTIVGGDDHVVLILRTGGEAEGGIQLPLAIAFLEVVQLLRAGVIVVETVGTDLHPEVLLAVDIDALHRPIDAHLGKHPVRMAVERLIARIVDAVVHALLQPQLAIAGLLYLLGIVVAHRGGVAVARVVGLDTESVIAVQAVGGAYPQEAAGVSVDAVDL